MVFLGQPRDRRIAEEIALPQRAIGHDGDAGALGLRQQLPFNAAFAQMVHDLVGRATRAVFDERQFRHVGHIEIAHPPFADLALGPQPLEGGHCSGSQPILLHGHCHQKAFGAVSPILDVLRLIPGAKPELIESSCCGMAGSFGYEASHFEVSMQMAEASLLPAVRNNPDAIVVADGTSCRHQIADGAQREAVHVARLLDSLIA